MAQQERRRILFVGGVAPHISERALFEHFSQFSELTKVRIMREKKTRESKGYAYITVADSRSIPQIMSVQHLILGRKLDVQLATSKGDKHEWKVLQRYRRVYAVGLPPGTTNEQVAEAFQQFGEVRNAFIIREHESRIQLEYAYIQFEDASAAESALSSVIKINGQTLQCEAYSSRYQLVRAATEKIHPVQNQAEKHQCGTQQVLFDFVPTNIDCSGKFSTFRLTYDSPSNYRFNINTRRSSASRIY